MTHVIATPSKSEVQQSLFSDAELNGLDALMSLADGMLDNLRQRKQRRQRRNFGPDPMAGMDIMSYLERINAELDATPDTIPDAPEVWTEEDVIAVHIKMLVHHISLVMKDSASKASRDEAWEWIMYRATGAFSFVACVEAFSKELGFMTEEGRTCIDVGELRHALVAMAIRAGML